MLTTLILTLFIKCLKWPCCFSLLDSISFINPHGKTDLPPSHKTNSQQTLQTQQVYDWVVGFSVCSFLNNELTIIFVIILVLVKTIHSDFYGSHVKSNNVVSFSVFQAVPRHTQKPEQITSFQICQTRGHNSQWILTLKLSVVIFVC